MPDKKVVDTETKSVVPGIFNAIIPGPSVEATVTYEDGSQKTGYGDSKTEAVENAKDK